MRKKIFTFESDVWLYPGMAGWHFVTLPKKEAAEIRSKFSRVKRGWGSLPVRVTIGETSWNTSIFPDKRSGSYVLPIKADVRKKEGIVERDMVELILKIRA